MTTFGSGVVPEEVIRAMLLQEHVRLQAEGTLGGDTFQQNWGVDPVYKIGSSNVGGSGPLIDAGETGKLVGGVDFGVLLGGQVYVADAYTPAVNMPSPPLLPLGSAPTLTAEAVPLVGGVSQPSTSYAEATGGFVNGRLGRVFFTSIRNRQITGIRVGTMPMVVMGPGSARPASTVPGGGTGDVYFSED